MTFATGTEYEKLAYQAGADISSRSLKRRAPKRLATDPPVYNGNRVTSQLWDYPGSLGTAVGRRRLRTQYCRGRFCPGQRHAALINVPWDQALDIILQAKGLDKRRNGSVIWVAPTKEIADREQALEDARIAMEVRSELLVDYIAISYGKAEDIAKLLTTGALESTSNAGRAEPVVVCSHHVVR